MSTDPLASTQKPWRPDDVYRCRHENILNLGTYGECASCYQRFDPADLESSRWPTRLAFSPDESADDGELTSLEIEQARDYFETFHRMPDWAAGKLSIAPTVQDSGELIPGYEAEAWDEPAAHAWKTPITFRGMIFTVYTGSVSGSTAGEVRAFLQHEYRAAEIGMPEVAR